MSLEITLRVNGSDGPGDGSSNPSERIVSHLERLDGVLSVRYDQRSRRFAVSYDHKQTNVLTILRQIEIAGQKAGQVYHPTDIQPT